MSKIEILAPVGSEEMLRAAVFSGADAVYLGFSGFNARTGAGNFDADSLKEAVRFCHARGVAVHVALNTTVYGGELNGLADAVRAVAASGADAVICQDLAVAKLIGDIAPQLPRHGSTQMSVHSLQGALELKELGFTKACIRRLSAARGLPTAEKPALACLATRIPFGTRLDAETMRRIDEAETRLMALGFAQVRVRAHGGVARIEVPKDRIPEAAARAQEVAEAVRACGFDFAALDLDGYKMGSLNLHVGEK